MIHYLLLKAGFAFSFPFADAAGELMTHEGPAFRYALGKCVTETPSRESASQYSLGMRYQKARYTRPGPIHGRSVPRKARAWTSDNKLAPHKANSRQKNVQTCFRTILWPVLARGRPWPACFVHLSRELTVQWWHRSWRNCSLEQVHWRRMN